MTRKQAPILNESGKIVLLTGSMLSVKRDHAHFGAVQAHCAFALELYIGLLELAAKGNGISTQALLRTLFETVVTAVILVKHEEKLGDFEKHGRLTTFRMARSIPADSRFAGKVTSFRARTAAECDALYAYFKPTGNWHKLGSKASLDEAELPENMYDRFYVRASSIAHGHPFVVVKNLDMEGKNWKVGVRSKRELIAWNNQAYVMASLLMVHLLDCIDRKFSLGMHRDIAFAGQEVHAIAHTQMDAAAHPST